MKESVVYLIRCTSTGLIKIGTSTNIDTRVSRLQEGNPGEMQILATMPGSKGEEKVLHKLFADKRVRGEWFDMRHLFPTVPNEVTVFGNTITTIWKKDLKCEQGTECFGLADYDKLIIEMDESLRENPRRALQIWWHEFWHIISDMLEMDLSHERIAIYGKIIGQAIMSAR